MVCQPVRATHSFSLAGQEETRQKKKKNHVTFCALFNDFPTGKKKREEEDDSEINRNFLFFSLGFNLVVVVVVFSNQAMLMKY